MGKDQNKIQSNMVMPRNLARQTLLNQFKDSANTIPGWTTLIKFIGCFENKRLCDECRNELASKIMEEALNSRRKFQRAKS